MKKIFIITLIGLFTGHLFAQDNEIKNVRFGLLVVPSINWYKPDGKIIAGNGAVPKFGGGLSVEFRLAKVASIVTGLQINLDGGKIKYNNGGYTAAGANTASYYYDIAEDEILKYDSYDHRAYGVGGPDSKYFTHYQLNERTYKVTYLTIPLALKLKTKEIGMFTYYGQIGINSSFRWKAKADDKLTLLDNGATDEKSGVVITKDVSFYTASLTFGAGAELNLAGTTSLVLGLHYNLGFTNVLKKESEYLEKTTNGRSIPFEPVISQMPQTIKTNALVLSIGFLF